MRGKVLSMIVKCWLCLLPMDFLEIVRSYYEWQINNLKVEGWTRRNLKKKIG
jgi:hypothetical protein